ncbi:hypothetical protein [Streptomyces sp. LN325]|uniref:hypothetical protein n=1 Tax=Streptomyces sp. LN325 TaxID=3112976 RepID=UPI0037103F5F
MAKDTYVAAADSDLWTPRREPSTTGDPVDGHVRLVDPMILARRILDEYVLGPAVPTGMGRFHPRR